MSAGNDVKQHMIISSLRDDCGYYGLCMYKVINANISMGAAMVI